MASSPLSAYGSASEESADAVSPPPSSHHSDSLSEPDTLNSHEDPGQQLRHGMRDIMNMEASLLTLKTVIDGLNSLRAELDVGPLSALALVPADILGTGTDPIHYRTLLSDISQKLADFQAVLLKQQMDMMLNFDTEVNSLSKLLRDSSVNFESEPHCGWGHRVENSLDDLARGGFKSKI